MKSLFKLFFFTRYALKTRGDRPYAITLFLDMCVIFFGTIFIVYLLCKALVAIFPSIQQVF